jgi:calcineurin-like phosphoesterase family protein
MGKSIFTSDWHLNHTNILKYTSRPYENIEEMETEFIQNLIDLYKPGDRLFFLGDISFGGRSRTRNILDKFRTYKIKNITYIYGNHDINNRNIINNSKIISSAEDIKLIKFNVYEEKKKAILCHYPLRSWSGKDTIMIHGHSHGEISPYHNSIDISIDNAFKLFRQYRPFVDTEITEIIKDINENL